MSVSRWEDIGGFAFHTWVVEAPDGFAGTWEQPYGAAVLEAKEAFMDNNPEPWGVVAINPNGDAFLIDLTSTFWIGNLIARNLRKMVGFVTVVPSVRTDLPAGES